MQSAVAHGAGAGAGVGVAGAWRMGRAELHEVMFWYVQTKKRASPRN